KVNHGVRPDGSYAFNTLPESARDWSIAQHAAFWADKDVPDSWTKYRQIVLYWLAKGVDGFRYDMAEMVPVEFWSYLNSSIKQANPDAFLLAEVYNPLEYRNYIQLGRIDYLYDKVGLYDAIKPVMQGTASTGTLAATQAAVLDIDEHMLHFLENHDEERIASANFAGDANKGKPAMVVSALIGRSPTMIYFAQELGEAGDGNDANFNNPPKMRTTQYDYWGVPSQQRWMNGGRFDGGALSDEEKALRDFYRRVLNFSAGSSAAAGNYAEIHSYNRALEDSTYNDRVFSFVRWSDDEQLLVVANFSAEPQEFELGLPEAIVATWSMADGRYRLREQLYGIDNSELVVELGTGRAGISLAPLESLVYRIGGLAH
ncbi:MAG: alpha-amylase family glycosyl hydrolase, partial [Gammaproteobacteria bacterium]|nr:alpha-amylase family glycosyl hydrolase [Gammaproteobacteria bacterium]